MLTVDHLDQITGNGGNAGRKVALVDRLARFGGPICAPPVLAQCLAQMMHESGALRYVREIWGPTKAQRGYDGRLDLGNIIPGDGKRYLGRDLLQVTGRSNYRALTAWVREEFGDGPDFEAVPDLLEDGRWLGIGAIWYLRTRPGLLGYAVAGNIEMVTRRINGGLNGYADRLEWYRRTALVLLGYGRDEVARFQCDHGLTADGICGPATRATLHHELNDI
ncbi:peptidoglycan-binding protein [Rhodobacter capsulatus]|uniref:peptidoglycan-binding protein n=1 Tax=Rhodobacter capsulatus TaxID=1061 RepID=UPI00402776AD